MAAPLNISTLGQGCNTLSSSAEDIGIQLQRSMLNIKSSFLTDDGRGVDYKRVKDSAEFKEYCKISSSLEQLDLLSLSEIEKKAFFISILSSTLFSFQPLVIDKIMFCTLWSVSKDILILNILYIT
jgi:hypothetical protein